MGRPEVLKGGRGRAPGGMEDPGPAGGACLSGGRGAVGGASGAGTGAAVGRRAATAGEAAEGAAGAEGAAAAGAAAAGAAAAGAAGLVLAGAAGAGAEGAAAAGLDGGRGEGVAAVAAATSLAGRLLTRPDLAERVGSADGRVAAAGAESVPDSSTGALRVLAAAGPGLISSGGGASGFFSTGSWAATGRRRLSRSALRRTRSA
jgi:hypothetical protein